MLPVVRTGYDLTVASLIERHKLGEGMSLAINLSLLMVLVNSASQALAIAFVSLAVLSLMYTYNDLVDAPKDHLNPKKNQKLVQRMVQYQPSVQIWHIGGQLVLVTLLATLGFGQMALAALTAFVLNIVYSHRAKYMPGFDVWWVAMWGMAYAAIVPEVGWHLLTLIGLMTGISHLYQIQVDRQSDADANFETLATKTSLVFGWHAALWVAMTGFWLWAVLGPVWVWIAGLLAMIFAWSNRGPWKAWLVTKIIFVFLWLMALFTEYQNLFA